MANWEFYFCTHYSKVDNSVTFMSNHWTGIQGEWNMEWNGLQLTHVTGGAQLGYLLYL